jgi:hypothetical protein
VRHGAVPWSEPLAWTRAGQPYYAYSWLAQVLFYALLRAFGPLGLHLLEGALCGAVALATLRAAGEFGWSRSVRFTLACINLAILWGVSHTIRPQQFLLLCVPLAWGIAARIRRTGTTWPRLAALTAVGCLAANTHIFFAITATPIAYYLIIDKDTRRWGIAGAALLLGWLLSPYGLAWPRVFALNFSGNILINRPPVIREFIPGFEYWSVSKGAFVVGIILLLLPPAWSARAASPRERVTALVFWCAGLSMFAYAGRLLVAWWALAFPLAGGAIAATFAALETSNTEPRVRRLLAGAAPLLVLLVAAPAVRTDFWRYEGDTVHRMLPRAAEDPALWLPSWLICHTRTGAHGKLFTEFNYGSELSWRLPGYSMSIDGRTIFPDSDAIDFAFIPRGWTVHRHATTWRGADLAMVSRRYWLSDTLPHEPAWILLADSWPAGRGAVLFARKDWWQQWGATTDVPASAIFPGESRTHCAAAGSFPVN